MCVCVCGLRRRMVGVGGGVSWGEALIPSIPNRLLRHDFSRCHRIHFFNYDSKLFYLLISDIRSVSSDSFMCFEMAAALDGASTLR